MLKICLWLNIPSIHQTPLIHALTAMPEVDLQVRYYQKYTDTQERVAQGWQAANLGENERFADSVEALYAVPEWRERIHIVPGISHPFCKALLQKIEAEGLRWCHWSERTGISFAMKVRFNPFLLRWLLPLLNRLFRATYARRINQTALGVFAIGRLAEQDFIAWGVRREKIRHLYYSCADLPETPMRQASQQKRFLYLGSLYHLKGIDVLLKAFATLKGSGWKLILVGKDLSQGHYAGLARRLQITEQVEWIGPVPSTQVHQWLAQADVLILPTRFDGWGAVLNEAANAGKALISTTQCGAAWHLIVPGENGFRVEPGNVRQLAAAMAEYIRQPELALQHGHYSRNLYFREFTARCNAERVVAALQEWQKNKS
jgi:glycosyltransferase involved in cell wall biosynthesis